MKNRKSKDYQHVFLTTVVESDSHPMSSIKGKAMEEAAQWQGIGAVVNAAGGSWIQELKQPASQEIICKAGVSSVQLQKLEGRERPFGDCMLISLALCIIISVKPQTYFGISIPITQMRKLSHEVTCSKSHLQLISDLEFKLKDSKSEVKAFHLVLLTMYTPPIGSKLLKETENKLGDELRITGTAQGGAGQPKRGPTTVSGQQ